MIFATVISDFSYAWGRTADAAFTEIMREALREDPGLVARMRSTFVKVGRETMKATRVTLLNVYRS